MSVKSKIILLSLSLLLLSACGLQPESEAHGRTMTEKYKSHKPGDKEDFINKMLHAGETTAQWDLSLRSHEQREKIQALHKDLYKNFPVYYDWWLQDGGNDDIHWYKKSLSEALTDRLRKLHIDLQLGNNPESIHEGFSQWIDACVKRREQRLAEFIQGTPEVAYTKFEVLRPSFFAYTEGLSDARDECNFFPNGQLALLTMKGIWAEEEILISDPDGMLRDPDVHFDGKHLLFAWKKSYKEDDYHLYEMEFPSRKVKQITHGLGHADFEPVYLPDENIMFSSSRNGNAVDCWKVEVSNMYLCDREGQFIRRIGYDQVHTVKPSVLDDGRVIYTRWEYNDRGQIYTQPLFQMNPDGTAQTEYYGENSFFPTTVVHARQIPGTRKVMATFNGHHTPQHGKVGIIDPEAGRDENEGVMLVAPLRKPRAEQIDRYGQFGEQFQYPYPLNSNDFVVSYSPLGYHTEQPINFGIYWMNVDGDRELLVYDPELSSNQAVPLAPRKRPFVRPSTVDYRKKEGVYYMQNIYEGNGLEGIEPGTIKKLRLVEIIFRQASVGSAYGSDKGGGGHAFTPVGVGNTSWDVKRILGTVNVETDGSAFFSVPARTPIYFQALDENDRVVQTMRSWSTLQPGEIQSCVGCHEHKNSVPVASHPVSLAMNKGVQNITPEGIGVRNFSYIKEVQPIWDAQCIACHDGTNHTMSLKGDLKVVDKESRRKFSDSYLSLTHAQQEEGSDNTWRGNAHHPEVNWISNLSEPTLLRPYFAGSNTSNLIKRLENGHGGTKLTREEIATVSLWLDMCAPFIGDYREANNWSKEEEDYYRYYEKKAEKAHIENEENIRLYVESLLSQK